ncbi:hypothetical protein [Intestinirhabdus alba]|uniref:Uncharacterized protein n=1 Tax=Intestinirhabdus alba TaxID=2899544 RepID=A0A6L6IIX9_9ENTR|nr:hypothetical protein [Intestinirhabdus alba]MTH45894.1 hypothetical protein [Intestinirhabdus alba]
MIDRQAIQSVAKQRIRSHKFLAGGTIVKASVAGNREAGISANGDFNVI